MEGTEERQVGKGGRTPAAPGTYVVGDGEGPRPAPGEDAVSIPVAELARHPGGWVAASRGHGDRISACVLHHELDPGLAGVGRRSRGGPAGRPRARRPARAAAGRRGARARRRSGARPRGGSEGPSGRARRGHRPTWRRRRARPPPRAGAGSWPRAPRWSGRPPPPPPRADGRTARSCAPHAGTTTRGAGRGGDRARRRASVARAGLPDGGSCRRRRARPNRSAGPPARAWRSGRARPPCPARAGPFRGRRRAAEAR